MDIHKTTHTKYVILKLSMDLVSISICFQNNLSRRDCRDWNTTTELFRRDPTDAVRTPGLQNCEKSVSAVHKPQALGVWLQQPDQAKMSTHLGDRPQPFPECLTSSVG